MTVLGEAQLSSILVMEYILQMTFLLCELIFLFSFSYHIRNLAFIFDTQITPCSG